jgi:HEAT repeat protein
MLALAFFVTASAVHTPPPAPIDSAWSMLRQGSMDTSADRRARAILALGLITRDQRAEDMAEHALAESSSTVRAAAATALGQIGMPAAVPRLRPLLEDPDLSVVISAADALYQLHAPDAYNVYYSLLTGERKGPGLIKSQIHQLKQRQEIEKLAFETGIGFVPFGGAGYEAWKRIMSNRSMPLLILSAERLATDPDPKAGDALVGACQNKHWQVRAAAVSAISRRGDKRLIRALVPLLTDPNDTVRFDAAAAIVHLVGPYPAKG